MDNSRKRILLITQYFHPENFKSNDIAFDLTKRGYEVEVLTGIPNYPKGQFHKGYGVFSKRVETISNVKIYRSFQFPRGNGSGPRLALNYLSFAFFATIWALLFFPFKKYNAIIVHEPSPITQGIPAVILKRLKNIPLYFWVLDLWPESLISAGGIKNKNILSFFERIVKFVYDHSDKILISSKGFKKSICKKGNYADKIIYFPNWAEDLFTQGKQLDIPRIEGEFKIMFAGNIGEAQDFNSIMKAINILRDDTRIKWYFIGDGRKKEFVEEFIKTHNLENQVFLLGRYPLEAMPAFFESADAMLVTLKDELIFNLTVPAKLQAYMAAKKPVLAMLNGEGADIIKESDCGYVVNAGDYSALVIKIQGIVNSSKQTFLSKGDNGLDYFNKNFRKERCIDNLCNIIDNKKHEHINNGDSRIRRL